MHDENGIGFNMHNADKLFGTFERAVIPLLVESVFHQGIPEVFSKT